jgi:hypothetical protein
MLLPAAASRRERDEISVKLKERQQNSTIQLAALMSDYFTEQTDG